MTLPTGIPRLNALVREEAERRAQSIVDALHLHRGMLSDHAEGALVEAVADLLRDLTRPESRDWAARTLADLVGLADDASRRSTAPSWGRFVCGEHSDGDATRTPCTRPIWVFMLGDRHEPTLAVFATCGSGDEEHRHVIRGIDALTSPDAALCLALVTVCKEPR